MRDEEKKLIDAKEKILQNLSDLVDMLQQCENIGFHDYERAVYNELVDLQDETEAIDIYLELQLVINRSQTVEKQIERFLSQEGVSTTAINWPDIS